MSVVYNQNFDGLTPPALPANWTAIVGSWATTTNNPVSSPNALVSTSAHDGDYITCSAFSAIADMDVRYDVDFQNGMMGVLLRMSADGQSGYRLSVWDLPISQFQVAKIVGGVPTQIAIINTGYTGPTTAGTKISVRARIQGSTISLKVWPFGTTEPSTFAGTTSDGSITAPGFFGIWNTVISTGLSTVDNIQVDNLQTATLSVSPSSVVTSSTGSSLALTGAGTSWTAGTPGSPTFTVSGGTITGQTVNSATSATLTYTAPGSAGTVTITDPSTGATANLTINAAATDFSFSPSSQNTTGGAGVVYALQANGTPSASVPIALSDGGAGGTFSPTSVTLTDSTSHNVTYTPSNSASPGTITLHAQASGGLTTSHNANCVVQTGPQTIPVTNANLAFSPGNWDHLTTGTFGVATETMQTTATGASLQFNVTNTVNLSINVDTSTLSGLGAGNTPILAYTIDHDAFTDVQLTAGQTSVVLSTSLSTGPHLVQVYVKQTSSFVGDRWGASGVSPTNVVRINGVVIDAGAALQSFTPLSNTMLIFGDSITETYNAIGNNDEDGTQGFAAILGQALNAEVGIAGYSSQGWDVAGGGNIPAFKTAYPFYSAGRARSLTGFTYIAEVQGTNDAIQGVSAAAVQADALAWIGQIRAAASPGTIILICVPPGGFYAANFAAAVAAYKAANPSDTAVYCIDIGDRVPTPPFAGTYNDPGEYNSDSHHPNLFGHARIGAALAAKVTIAAGGGTTGAGYSRSRVVNA